VAVRQVVRLVDDVDGSVAAETVHFGIDGVSYEVDLSAANAAELRGLLRRYVAAGRRAVATAAAADRPSPELGQAGPAARAEPAGLTPAAAEGPPAAAAVRAVAAVPASAVPASAVPASAVPAAAAPAGVAPGSVPPARVPPAPEAPAAAAPVPAGGPAPAAPARPVLEWAAPPSAEPEPHPAPAGRGEVAGVRFSDQPAAN
jgi:hypothetical protein